MQSSPRGSNIERLVPGARVHSGGDREFSQPGVDDVTSPLQRLAREPVAAGRRLRAAEPGPTYKPVTREKDRWWEVRDPRGKLVCVTVYKRGAVEVVQRLAA